MAKSKTAGRMKVLGAFLLLFGPALLLILISTRSCEHNFTELDDYGAVPAFNLMDAGGMKINKSDFKEKVVLFTTLQTTCPDSCGVSFWSLNQLLYQDIRKNQKRLDFVKIVSVVTDLHGNPVDDISGIQELLSNEVEGYDPSIWILASGDAKSLFDITHNGVNLLEEGKQYTGGQAFNELMVLMDKKQHVRMVLNGHTEGMVRKMKEHIALLKKEYDKEAYRKKHQ